MKVILLLCSSFLLATGVYAEVQKCVSSDDVIILVDERNVNADLLSTTSVRADQPSPATVDLVENLLQIVAKTDVAINHPSFLRSLDRSYQDDHPSIISRLELGKLNNYRDPYTGDRYRLVAYNPTSYKVIPYLPRILHQRRRSFYPC